ncbi:hypothetical protein GCM10010921_30240 [Microbacterium album]|uniref:Uncharacterized protein n=1 Tax=Microbacterium album TaxID=2053191 RepID=A0A917MNG5_9MICO|nr:hypothetical protein GCM10010921_30240 [Microbacterium album]
MRDTADEAAAGVPVAFEAPASAEAPVVPATVTSVATGAPPVSGTIAAAARSGTSRPVCCTNTPAPTTSTAITANKPKRPERCPEAGLKGSGVELGFDSLRSLNPFRLRSAPLNEQGAGSAGAPLEESEDTGR